MDEEIVNKTLQAVIIAKEDAEKKGLKKGNPGSGSVTCPICNKMLLYSVASNGHMMARCESQNCVAWIE